MTWESALVFVENQLPLGQMHSSTNVTGSECLPLQKDDGSKHHLPMGSGLGR
jgi:hypothetical protein